MKRGENRRIIGEANAFRAWQFCQSCDWECTHTQIADAIGVEISTVGQILERKGWRDRIKNADKRREINSRHSRRASGLRVKDGFNSEVDVCDLLGG